MKAGRKTTTETLGKSRKSKRSWGLIWATVLLLPKWNNSACQLPKSSLLFQVLPERSFSGLNSAQGGGWGGGGFGVLWGGFFGGGWGMSWGGALPCLAFPLVSGAKNCMLTSFINAWFVIYKTRQVAAAFRNFPNGEGRAFPFVGHVCEWVCVCGCHLIWIWVIGQVGEFEEEITFQFRQKVKAR